jgi:hypothetical protein
MAYSGFPVDLPGVGALHAAFLNESRTRSHWWRPVQEIRIRGPLTIFFERFSPTISETAVGHPSQTAKLLYA